MYQSFRSLSSESGAGNTVGSAGVGIDVFRSDVAIGAMLDWCELMLNLSSSTLTTGTSLGTSNS